MSLYYIPPAPNEDVSDDRLEVMQHSPTTDPEEPGRLFYHHIAYDLKFKFVPWRYATQADVDAGVLDEHWHMNDKPEGSVVDVGDIIPSKGQYAQVWCTATMTDLLQADEKIVEILKAMREASWNNSSLVSKLRGRIKLVFEMQYFQTFEASEAGWLAEMKDQEPERYKFIVEQELTKLREDSKLSPKERMRITRVFGEDLELTAHWCMAHFSHCPIEWKGGVEIKPFDLSKFEPAHTPGKGEIRALRLQAQGIAPKKPRLTEKQRVAAMPPEERRRYEIWKSNERKIAALKRQGVLDQDTLDILGVYDPE